MRGSGSRSSRTVTPPNEPASGLTERELGTRWSGLVLLLVPSSFRLGAHNWGHRRGGLMKRLIPLTSLSLITALVLASSASAQGSFCTTTANASGAAVAKCVDAPSASPSATTSPEVTVVNGGPQTASPTVTATATGASTNPAVAAVGGELPPTGGTGRLAVLATMLLVGSGAMSYVILRRSN